MWGREMVIDSLSSRKHYIDNLRWILLLVLVPYHTAMAWNAWGEANYIFFEGSKVISSLLVFFSPFFMPMIFLLAGISAFYSLRKRTVKQFLIERVKRLIIPLVAGTVLLMPVMSYIGDKFNYGYSGTFIGHYAVFFTKFTDLVGADGGFTFGQFWFLIYLFLISVILAVVVHFTKGKGIRKIPLWVVFAIAIPLPFLNDFLSVGGKSFVEYGCIFLLGYYIFNDDAVITFLKKYKWILLVIGLTASFLDVYMYIWSGRDFGVYNEIAKCIAEWFMILALLGIGRSYLNFSNKITSWFSSRSFLFFCFHFVCVVATEYLLEVKFDISGAANFLITIAASYVLTFLCCEIVIRIPLLRFLFGTRKPSQTLMLNKPHNQCN